MPGPFADPEVRRAYLLTKAAVLVVAAVATWPLAKRFGPRAWVALGVFAAILVLLTAVALLLGGRRSAEEVASEEEAAAELGEEAPPPGSPVVLPVEDSLDLHPFAPHDLPGVVADYLEAAHGRGLREVRLIHGRGIGVQRERVRSLLSRHPLVAAFADAPPGRGGWGATVAVLRERPEPATAGKVTPAG